MPFFLQQIMNYPLQLNKQYWTILRVLVTAHVNTYKKNLKNEWMFLCAHAIPPCDVMHSGMQKSLRIHNDNKVHFYFSSNFQWILGIWKHLVPRRLS
jgi:hypothetical protein